MGSSAFLGLRIYALGDRRWATRDTDLWRRTRHAITAWRICVVLLKMGNGKPHTCHMLNRRVGDSPRLWQRTRSQATHVQSPNAKVNLVSRVGRGRKRAKKEGEKGVRTIFSRSAAVLWRKIVLTPFSPSFLHRQVAAGCLPGRRSCPGRTAPGRRRSASAPCRLSCRP